MAAIILPRKHYTQPQGRVQIAPEYQRNLLQGFLAHSRTNANDAYPFTVLSAQPSTSREGVSSYLTGSSGHISSPTIAGTQPWTLIAYCVPRTLGEHAVVIHAESPGSSTRDRSVHIRSTGAASAYVFDGAEKPVSTGSGAIAAGVPVIIGASCDGSVLRVFAGQKTATVGVSNAGFNGYTTPELVFGYGAAPFLREVY